MDGMGLVAEESGIFSPGDITNMLGIQPFDTKTAGMPRKNGRGTYTFSDWAACKQTEPVMDAEKQCRKIVRELRPHLSKLQEIKKKFNVDFTLMIVPHIYNEENPILGFDREIIEFCYLTDTEIAVDMYIYDKE